MAPYIVPSKRPELDVVIEPMVEYIQTHGLRPGEENYLLTNILLAMLPDKPGYEDFEAIVGRLEVIKLEFTRRVLFPYEDSKRILNGDVFGVPPAGAKGGE